MKNFGKWALCLIVCVAFLALPALADRPWADDPPRNGHPEYSVSPTVGPMYYGQPIMLDEHPWIEGPPRHGNPEYSVSPTVGPNAWWLQPALDGHPWTDEPPKGKEPLTP